MSDNTDTTQISPATSTSTGSPTRTETLTVPVLRGIHKAVSIARTTDLSSLKSAERQEIERAFVWATEELERRKSKSVKNRTLT